MPRKKQRFGKLHQELKSSGYTATGGRAGEYLNYLKGTNKIVVARKPSSQYLKIFNVGVTPFGKEPNSGTNVETALQTGMTIQADIIRALFNTVAPDAAFGIERDLSKTNIDDIFYAAQCVITVVPTTSLTAAKVQVTSGITKADYKKFAGIRAGSVPYGRTTTAPQAQTEGGTPTTPTLATVAEEDVRKSLMVALKKGTIGGDYSIFSLHFVPEEFVAVRSFDRAKPSGAATTLPSG